MTQRSNAAPVLDTTRRFMVAPFLVKAESIDEDSRTFEGLASVWGLDLGDDVMHRGAFKKTLGEWKKSPDAIPLLNSHNQWDVMSALGQMLEAEETKDGLWTKWEIIDGEDGDRVLARLRPSLRTGKSPVSKMSIGYVPKKFDFEESETARFGQLRNLREVELKETSLVLFAMAPGARIDVQSVKSFYEFAAAAQPQLVDPEVKAELRRLSSRIGKLLAPAAVKSEGAEGGEAPPPAAAEPPTPKAAPAVAPPATAAGEPAAAAAPAAAEPESKGEPQYLYSEALQQRLLGLRIHATAHQTGKVE